MQPETFYALRPETLYVLQPETLLRHFVAVPLQPETLYILYFVTAVGDPPSLALGRCMPLQAETV